MSFDWQKAVADGFDEKRRQYIEHTGTHYLELIGYDWFDGSYDEKTQRGFKQKVGPLFLFKCVGSETMPTGLEAARFVALNRSSEKGPAATTVMRRMAVGEARDLFAALLVSKGGPEEAENFDASVLTDIMPNVDAVNSAFIGTVVRCDAKEKNGFVDSKWFADDRE